MGSFGAMIPLRSAFLVLAAFGATLQPGLAGTYGSPPLDNVAKVEILPGWSEGGQHVAAISISLAPGWKTYWRAPGDAGIPPSFSWQGSRNLAGLRFHWPVPHVFEINGMRPVGYKDKVVFPIALTPSRPGDPILLKGQLSLGVCRDVCMPLTVDIDANIPPGGAADPRISTALGDRALTGAEAGVTSAICDVTPIDDGLRLNVRLAIPRQGRHEMVVVETGTPTVWVSESKSSRSGNVLTANADLVPPDGKPFALDRSEVRITVIGDDRAVDIHGCTGG